ncbi:hypothetical protein IWQ60_001629 [Tieghemiomyces parasiticus]|uniref:Carbonic anhydrase n=1 Tax=Tieghemiomyces parasiticus TaxID=78921 RepID=A0A9W8ADQ1_9FUNG|nr:hypothetical protein IWQ60_001629 [Tieghemiomyces parasiticus]
MFPSLTCTALGLGLLYLAQLATLHVPFASALCADEKAIDTLLTANGQWATEFQAQNPKLAIEISQSQSPKILWYSCMDSRFSPEIITKSNLGDLFVHRSIANVVTMSDLSAMAGLEYAVNVLKVEHIVVSGHTKCGGIHAAMDDHPAGDHLEPWLSPTKRLHQLQLKGYTSDGKLQSQPLPADQQELDLNKFNIRNSLYQLSQSGHVQARWKDATAPPLSLHGLLLDISTRKLEKVMPSAGNATEAEQAYSIPTVAH